MARARYVPNRRLAVEIAREPEYRACIAGYAARIVEHARPRVPLGHRAYHLREALRVGVNRLGVPVVEVRSSRWHWIEYGSVHNTPTPYLRLGTEAAGLIFVDKRGEAA